MSVEQRGDLSKRETGVPNPEALLTGPLRPMILHFLEHGPKDTKLYAFNPAENPIFNRESGAGELKLSGVGAPRIQISDGKNNWKVVDMASLDLAATDALRRPILPEALLQLDEESLQLVRAYQQESQQTEAGKDLVRRQQAASVRDLQPVGERTREVVKSKFELGLEKYGLVTERMKVFYGAGEVVERIFLEEDDYSFIDITTRAGQRLFCQEWFKICKTDLPPPFVPPQFIFKRQYPGVAYPSAVDPQKGDFRYLNYLLERRVVANFNESDDGNQELLPRFSLDVHTYVMGWQESDRDKKDAWGKPFLESPSASRLLEDLGIQGVLATRTEVDKALWKGDPGDRKHSQAHEQIIRDMGLDPEEFMFRLIDYGEYARLASKLGWGKSDFCPHFDGYLIDGVDKKRYGLCGGDVDYGGASYVGFAYQNKKLPVRLVLARVGS